LLRKEPKCPNHALDFFIKSIAQKFERVNLFLHIRKWINQRLRSLIWLCYWDKNSTRHLNLVWKLQILLFFKICMKILIQDQWDIFKWWLRLEFMLIWFTWLCLMRFSNIMLNHMWKFYSNFSEICNLKALLWETQELAINSCALAKFLNFLSIFFELKIIRDKRYTLIK
jgi:hypothetical protein